MNFTHLLVSLGLALAYGVAHAAIAFESAPFDLEFPLGNKDAELRSELDCIAGVCKITNSYTSTLADHFATVDWRDAHGDRILYGTLPHVFGSSDISSGWSWTYEGQLAPALNFEDETGVADFTASINNGLNAPCIVANQASYTCGAKYLVFKDGVGNSSGQSEFRIIIEKLNWLLSLDEVTVEPDENGDPHSVLASTMQFGSSVEPLPGGLQFNFSAINLTGEPLSFAIAELGWATTIRPFESLSWGPFLPYGASAARLADPQTPAYARFTRTTVSVSGQDFDVGAAFGVFQPVPLPAGAYLLPSGLALLVCNARRYRRRGRVYSALGNMGARWISKE